MLLGEDAIFDIMRTPTVFGFHGWKVDWHYEFFSSENPAIPSEMAKDTLEYGAIICFRLLFELESIEFENI